MTLHKLSIPGAKLNLHLDGPEWAGATAATLSGLSVTDPGAGAEILAQALEAARAAGRAGVLGPMEGDTWHSYRYVIDTDGSAPFLMEPPDRPAERAALETAGFVPVSQYFSARQALVPRSAPPEHTAFAVTPWDGQDPEGLLRQVHALSTQAFAGNAFYKPIGVAAFLEMYRPMVPLMVPDLIHFARRPDGGLAGFVFAIPNYAEGPKSRTVILKTYASLERGAGRALVHAVSAAAMARGYETMIHALIHDDNTSADRSAAEGGTIFRRYALWGRRLDV